MRPTPTNEWGGSDSQRAEWTSARIARLERDRAELIEALRKFAEASYPGDEIPASAPIADCTELTEGDLRAARALLARLGAE